MFDDDDDWSGTGEDDWSGTGDDWSGTGEDDWSGTGEDDWWNEPTPRRLTAAQVEHNAKSTLEKEKAIAAKVLKQKADLDFYKSVAQAAANVKSTAFNNQQKDVLRKLAAVNNSEGRRETINTAKFYIAENFWKQNQKFFNNSQTDDYEKAMKVKDYKKIDTIAKHVRENIKTHERQMIVSGRSSVLGQTNGNGTKTLKQIRAAQASGVR